MRDGIGQGKDRQNMMAANNKDRKGERGEGITGSEGKLLFSCIVEVVAASQLAYKGGVAE